LLLYPRLPELESGPTLTLQLLGRSVEINKLLTQRINKFIKESLELAINRFEGGDLSGIIVS
jgi:cytoplasmic FMR1 interacting protein